MQRITEMGDQDVLTELQKAIEAEKAKNDKIARAGDAHIRDASASPTIRQFRQENGR